MASDDDDDFFGGFDQKVETPSNVIHLKASPVDELFALAPSTTPPPAKQNNPQYPGRTNPAPFSVQKLAKDYTQEAFDTIMEIMNNPFNEPSVRLDAAKHILDRGWGKPAQSIRQETIKYTLKDAEKALLQHRDEVDAKWEEARRAELERHAGYIDADVTVLADSATRSEKPLQDN